jgi:hypothetical protein
VKLRLTLLAVSLSGLSLAQERLEFEFEAPVVSRYVWRGLNVCDKPVYQPSLTAVTGAWSLNVFGSVEPSGHRASCTELSTTLAHTVDLGRFELSAGYAHYEYPNTAYVRTGELFAFVTLAAPGSPTIEVYGDVEAVKGSYARLSLENAWKVGPQGELVVGAAVGAGSRSHNAYYFEAPRTGLVDAGAWANYSHTLGKGSCAYVFGGFTTLLDRALVAGNGKRDNAFVGAGVSLSF